MWNARYAGEAGITYSSDIDRRGPQYKVKLTAHEALARAEASHFVDPADAAFMEQIKRKNDAALKEAALSYRGARVDEGVGYEDDETDGSETDNDEPKPEVLDLFNEVERTSAAVPAQDEVVVPVFSSEPSTVLVVHGPEIENENIVESRRAKFLAQMSAAGSTTNLDRAMEQARINAKAYRFKGPVADVDTDPTDPPNAEDSDGTGIDSNSNGPWAVGAPGEKSKPIALTKTSSVMELMARFHEAAELRRPAELRRRGCTVSEGLNGGDHSRPVMSAPKQSPSQKETAAVVSPTDPAPTTNLDGQDAEMPVWRRDLLRRRKSQARIQGTGIAAIPGRNRFARRKQEVTLVKGEPVASTSIAGAGPPLAELAQIPAAKNTSATPSLTGPATATKHVPSAEPDTTAQVVPTLALATAAAGPARVSVPANRFRSRADRFSRKAITSTGLQAVAAVP